MSLKELKSTLKSCTSSSSLDYTTYSYPFSLRRQEEEQQEPKRKPPKTSIREQLKNLEKLAADLDDSHTNEIIPLNKSCIDPQINPPQNNENDTNKPGNFEEEGDANEGFREEGDSEAGVFVQPHTEGPFEPLVLGPCPSRSGLILQVPASINCRLLEHQREGVKFLYNLYKEKHGGVLGDDMGLGKTIQTIAFVAAVLQKDVEDDPLVTNTIDKSRQIFKDRVLVLIICPTSVLQNWENEFNEWGTFNVAIYHGANKDLILEKLEQSGVEIILTSFDTYRIHGGNLCDVHWELVIVDEAHRLKNERSRLYKSFQSIKTKNFYGLTGTIMQNKIMDLFNVFDLLSPGCLGTREHFREYYDEPLKQGQRISAPERFVKIAEERKTHLLKVLRRYLLRRTKEETIGHLMMGKEDNVVFCAMSPLQKRVYTRLLNSPDFKSLILKDSPCSCGSKLTRVECCHKNVTDGIIWSYLHRESPDGCDSCPFCLVLPCLVKLQQVSNHLELIKPNPKDDPEKQKKDEALAAAVFEKDADLVGGVVQDESFMGLSDAKHCGKMRALEKLMVSWISRGDKILLFSYSVRMLDILEKFLIRKGYCFSRLDGSTPMNNRQTLVDNFNQSPSKQVFLISTRAGGIGLNLVSANRVVIFDPNWNPAQDLQAQDRSFRYGQRRHVTVFRLLAAGSLEELVYTRQIYKQQLFNIAVSGNPEKRYFEGVQDSKEFKGELFGICNLFRDISDRLFTNEIVGPHKERLQNNANDHKSVGMNQGADKSMQVDRKRDCLNDPGMNELRENYREDSPILENLLTDAGVMYMHRNEEVVNYGSHKSDRPTMIEPFNDNTMASCIVEERKKSEQIQKAVDSNQLDLGNQPNKKQQKSKEKMKVKVLDKQKKPRNVRFKTEKNKQYNILAQFKGMTELKFSKWLLSASSSEIEKLLSEYRQSAQKNKN